MGRKRQASHGEVGGWVRLYPEDGDCAHGLGSQLAHISGPSGKAWTELQSDSTGEGVTENVENVGSQTSALKRAKKSHYLIGITKRGRTWLLSPKGVAVSHPFLPPHITFLSLFLKESIYLIN